MKTNLLLIAIFFYTASSSEVKVYESFYATEISDETLLQFEELNNTFWCITEVELPCNADEFRRVDGSCNNLKSPASGAGRTPHSEFLPTVWGEGFSSRLAKDGTPLPAPRHVRTQTLAEGKLPHTNLTILLANYLGVCTEDTMNLHDVVGYSFWHTTCCTDEWEADDMCYPNPVPEDDPVHRYSGQRCMNMTKPITFQTEGCLANNTTPARVTSETPLIDLSGLYGNRLSDLEEKGRLYEGGLLKYEVDELGRIWPPSNGTACPLNKENETRCFDGPNNLGMNGIMGINLIRLWFWRQHNLNARELAKINPSWNDTILFNWAREINIGIFQHILYYEAFAAFLGKENLENSGVLSTDKSSRDLYDPDMIPQTTMEFGVVMRWVHSITEGTLYLYDSNGTIYDSVQNVDLVFRTGWMGVDSHLEGITQGSFRQPGAASDHVVDPDFSERILSTLHVSLDVFSNDLAKNRLSGFPGYTKYLEKCYNKNYTSFDDLEEFIDAERIKLLKTVYTDVEDIDLQAGMWSERMMEGGFAPSILFCVAQQQLLDFMKSDRFWYERPNKPFNDAQLAEIRKFTLARLICNNGDDVTELQAKPFEVIDETNPLVSCDEIPTIDYSAWAEMDA